MGLGAGGGVRLRPHERPEDIPYGPGNPDYEVDGMLAERIDGITFDEDLHEYRLDGSVIPSVTQIIEPVRHELGGSESVLEYKRQIGKALDKAIEIHEAGLEIDPESLDDAVAPFFAAWLQFKADSGFRALLNQPIVYSRKFRFAGTLDLLGTRHFTSSVPDELLDTKCVWTIDPATAIQTAGYAIAARESLGIHVKKRGGVQLLRDGKYKFHPYTNANDETVFQSCRNVHAWLTAHR